MTADRIVEVYSAGNIVEAQTLAEALEDAGVDAQVVGDMLGNATGWLPLTSAALRIWVREADEARAREVVAAWLQESQSIAAEGETDDEAAEPPEAAALHDADAEDRGGPAEPERLEEPASPEARPFRLVNQAIGIAGVACILAGTYYAMENWTVLRRFSARTEAQYVGYGIGYEEHPAVNSPDVPGRVRGAVLQAKYNIVYIYEVDGKEYYANLADGMRPPEAITVLYDPDRPAENIVGPLTPPWVSLLLGTVVGGLLFFVAWRFR